MTERGLVDVPDASARFLVDRRPGVPGSAVAAVLEGVRPILVEVQALSMQTAAPMPRRSAAGMESGRLAMLLAVLEQHAGIGSTGADVYASVAGGLRVTERGLDLALALAVAGAQLVVRSPRATPSRSASSAWAARCARCRSSSGDWPRRRASGSAAR